MNVDESDLKMTSQSSLNLKERNQHVMIQHLRLCFARPNPPCSASCGTQCQPPSHKHTHVITVITMSEDLLEIITDWFKQPHFQYGGPEGKT